MNSVINQKSVCLYLYTKIYTKRFHKSFQEIIKLLPNISYLLYKKLEIFEQKDNFYIDNR